MRIFAYLVCMTFASTLLPEQALAQKAAAPGKAKPAPDSEEQKPEKPTAPAPAQEASPGPDTPPVWRRALTYYELGEPEPALKLLREEVLRCAAEEGTCSSEQEGTLYACVGIVQAGGNNDHEKGVVAFRKALSLDPEIVLLSEYRTAEVLAAFDEAKTGEQAAKAGDSSPPPFREGAPSPAVISEEELEKRRQHEEDLLKKRAILLVTGVAQTGAAALNFDNDLYFGDGSGGLGHFAGSVLVAGMPGETSGFSMGVRGFGGVVLADRGSYGHFGFSGVLGSTIGKRQDNQFAYFLAEIGMDYFPSGRSPAWLFGFHGGASIGGLAVGGTLGMTAGIDVFMMMLGIEVGYGGLL